MPRFVQPDLTAGDQTVEARQRLLPRLTLKLLFLLVTAAVFLTWLIRLMIGNETALFCVLALLLMCVACLVGYAVVFLLAWAAARVLGLVRAPSAPPAAAGDLLIDSERWQ